MENECILGPSKLLVVSLLRRQGHPRGFIASVVFRLFCHKHVALLLKKHCRGDSLDPKIRELSEFAVRDGRICPVPSLREQFCTTRTIFCHHYRKPAKSRRSQAGGRAGLGMILVYFCIFYIVVVCCVFGSWLQNV